MTRFRVVIEGEVDEDQLDEPAVTYVASYVGVKNTSDLVVKSIHVDMLKSRKSHASATTPDPQA